MCLKSYVGFFFYFAEMFKSGLWWKVILEDFLLLRQTRGFSTIAVVALKRICMFPVLFCGHPSIEVSLYSKWIYGQLIFSERAFLRYCSLSIPIAVFPFKIRILYWTKFKGLTMKMVAFPRDFVLALLSHDSKYSNNRLYNTNVSK